MDIVILWHVIDLAFVVIAAILLFNIKKKMDAKNTSVKSFSAKLFIVLALLTIPLFTTLILAAVLQWEKKREDERLIILSNMIDDIFGINVNVNRNYCFTERTELIQAESEE